MRCVALLLIAVGCGDRAADPAPAPAPQPKCIAATVDPHDRVWVRRTDCTIEKCKDECLKDNDPSACMSRGIALERDPAQREEANAMFIRACELGTIAGCTNYAGFLWQNNKGNAAASCARDLFEKTCAAKDPFGCGMLGRMTIDNATTPEAIAAGKVALEGACDTYNGFPCRVLALELESTKLGAFDSAKITDLLARACQGGDTAACGFHITAAETFR